jgi:hypothetical protein
MMYIMATSFLKVPSSLATLGLYCPCSLCRFVLDVFDRAILHNPHDYPKPETFNPSRYLTSDGVLNPSIRDPRTACFGFGRRICPGRYIADASLFAILSTLLATIDIVRARDGSGKEIVPKVDMTSEIISNAESFPWRVQRRSRHAEELLAHTLDMTP